jgi:hypothetical protein
LIRLDRISRYRAATVHLLISAGIAALVLLIMLALWYPPPLFRAMGGSELIMLIVGVDVCIGPLITLIIFDTRKKELMFDLAVVAVLQLAALGYGAYAMYWGRPVFTVFTADPGFVVVPAVEIDAKNLAKGSREEYRTLSLTGPRLVATKEPTDIEARNDIVFLSIGGMGIQDMPQHYVPYDEMRREVLKASRPLADLRLAGGDRERLDRYLARSGRKAETLRCLPVRTKFDMLTAVVDAGSGDLIDILDVKPDLAASEIPPK